MWYPQWGHQGMMNTMAGSWNVYAQDFVPVWPLGSNSMSMGDGMNPGDSLGQMAWGMHLAMMNQWASGVEEGMPCKDVWQRSPGLMPPLDGRTENKICGIDNATQAVGELQVAKEVAALWNLAEDYTEESLRNDLAAIDFEPIVIRKLNEADGVWYFVFHEEYCAAAIVMALDGVELSSPYVKHNGDGLRGAHLKSNSKEHWITEMLESIKTSQVSEAAVSW